MEFKQVSNERQKIGLWGPKGNWREGIALFSFHWLQPPSEFAQAWLLFIQNISLLLIDFNPRLILYYQLPLTIFGRSSNIRVFYTFFFLNSSILSVGSREGEAADLSRVGSYKRLSTEKVSLVFCNIFRIISTREIVSLPKMCRKTQVYLSWVAEKTKGVAPWKSI